MARDVHAYDGGNHRADRRCPCGPRPMKDMNEPSRTIYVHRTPPQANERSVLPPGRAMTRYAEPPDRRTQP